MNVALRPHLCLLGIAATSVYTATVRGWRWHASRLLCTDLSVRLCRHAWIRLHPTLVCAEDPLKLVVWNDLPNTIISLQSERVRNSHLREHRHMDAASATKMVLYSSCRQLLYVIKNWRYGGVFNDDPVQYSVSGIDGHCARPPGCCCCCCRFDDSFYSLSFIRHFLCTANRMGRAVIVTENCCGVQCIDPSLLVFHCNHVQDTNQSSRRT